MKKTYEAPKAEKLEFDYTDTILASCGTMRKYVDGYSGCHATETNEWSFM